MKRFKEISKKIVSIKTFAKRNFLDDDGDGTSTKQVAPKRNREDLLMEVSNPAVAPAAACIT